MIAKNQKEFKFTGMSTILNAIKVRQKGGFTDVHWNKQLVKDESIKELKEMNYEVEDYEDVHSDIPMIKISWDHLIG